MRHWGWLAALAIVLVACGGTPATVTPNALATQTRVAEVAQLATASAPTATPVPTNTPVPPTVTPTAVPTPLPTATATTPPAPTATARPPTATTPPAAIKWHNLPLPPGSTLYLQVSDQSVIYIAPGNELTVSAFMDREWKALGLQFLATNTQSNTVFYVFAYPNDALHLVSYGVYKLNDSTAQVALIDNKP